MWREGVDEGVRSTDARRWRRSQLGDLPGWTCKASVAVGGFGWSVGVPRMSPSGASSSTPTVERGRSVQGGVALANQRNI